jgi:hypothetical protein
MTTKKLSILFAILIGFIISSCNNNDDLFSKVKFGETSENSFLNEQVNKGVFLDPNEDSTLYKFYFKTGKDSILTNVTLNYDKPKYGNIRTIKISLGGDTCKSLYEGMKDFYLRARGSRLKSDVDKIYNQYVEWYGKPDSIYYPRIFELKEERKATISIWYKEGYKIIFNIPYATKENTKDSALIYGNGYELWNDYINEVPENNKYYEYSEPLSIVYQVNNYYAIMKSLKDSIRKNLKPNDIVSNTVMTYEWSNIASPIYDRKINFTLGSISRIDAEEPKKVKAVRFDLVFYDQFGEEMYRIPNWTYQLEFPIEGGYFNKKVSSTPFTAPQFTLSYYTMSKDGLNLEKIRKYKQNNVVICKIDFKAVVFEDNTVCK